MAANNSWLTGSANDDDDQLILTIDEYMKSRDGDPSPVDQHSSTAAAAMIHTSSSTDMTSFELYHRYPTTSHNNNNSDGFNNNNNNNNNNIEEEEEEEVEQKLEQLEQHCSIAFTDFDHILTIVGGFGRFHKWLCVLIQLALTQLCSVWLLSSLSFVQPTTFCQLPEMFDNDTSYNVNETMIENNRTLTMNIHTNVTERRAFCKIYESGGCEKVHFESPFHSIIEEYSMICSRDWIPDLINTCQTMAFFLTFILSIAADKIGRVTVLRIGYITLVICNFAASMSTSWVLFMITRLITGILVHSLASWTQNWRYFILVVSIAGVPILFIMCFILTESPRWLIQRGRLREAARALTKLAHRNGRAKTFVIREENLHKVPICAESLGSAATDWIQLFVNRKMCFNVFLIAVTCFAVEFTAASYTHQVSEFEGPPWLSYIYFGLARLAIVPFVYYPDKIFSWFGRQQMTRWPLMLIATCYGILTVVLMKWDLMHWTNSVEYSLMLISAVACNFLWVAISQYQAELFPTYLRNSAAAVSSMFNPFAVMIVFQLIYMEKWYRAILAQTAFGVVLTVLIMACIFLPETKGIPLPDAAPTSGEFVCLKSIIKRLNNLCRRERSCRQTCSKADCRKALLDDSGDEDSTPF